MPTTPPDFVFLNTSIDLTELEQFTGPMSAWRTSKGKIPMALPIVLAFQSTGKHQWQIPFIGTAYPLAYTVQHLLDHPRVDSDGFNQRPEEIKSEVIEFLQSMMWTDEPSIKGISPVQLFMRHGISALSLPAMNLDGYGDQLLSESDFERYQNCLQVLKGRYLAPYWDEETAHYAVHITQESLPRVLAAVLLLSTGQNIEEGLTWSPRVMPMHIALNSVNAFNAGQAAGVDMRLPQVMTF